MADTTDEAAMMRELGANLLRPTAANADAARSAAGRTRSPREAWERMSARGLIPVSGGGS